MTIQHPETKEALAMLKQLAESIDFGMLCTDLTNQPFHAVPMSTKRVDDDGAIWFLSGRDSTHNANIMRNLAVQILYSEPISMRFLIVFGQALILDDRAILESLYKATDDAWFSGLDDSNLTAIKITPHAAHYWDVVSNELEALWDMGTTSFSGVENSIRSHRELKV